MNQDLYNSINADVIRNKEIMERTGVSPAKVAMIKPWYDLIKDSKLIMQCAARAKTTWKTLGRIEITRATLEDYVSEGGAPRRFWQRTYYDFDRDLVVCYPFGISQLVVVVRAIWYGSYALLHKLRRLPIYTEGDLRRARQAGIKRGREIEFEAQRGMLSDRTRNLQS